MHGWYQLAPFQFDEETDTLCYVLQLANERVLELKNIPDIEEVVSRLVEEIKASQEPRKIRIGNKTTTA